MGTYACTEQPLLALSFLNVCYGLDVFIFYSPGSMPSSWTFSFKALKEASITELWSKRRNMISEIHVQLQYQCKAENIRSWNRRCYVDFFLKKLKKC